MFIPVLPCERNSIERAVGWLRTPVRFDKAGKLVSEVQPVKIEATWNDNQTGLTFKLSATGFTGERLALEGHLSLTRSTGSLGVWEGSWKTWELIYPSGDLVFSDGRSQKSEFARPPMAGDFGPRC